MRIYDREKAVKIMTVANWIIKKEKQGKRRRRREQKFFIIFEEIVNS